MTVSLDENANTIAESPKDKPKKSAKRKPVAKVKCPVCPKFINKYILKQHYYVHLNLRLFKCGICPKAFNTKSLKTIHEKTHDDTQRFKCQICEKEFSNKANLKTHMYCHSEVRNFHCHCGRSFKLQQHLTTHQEIHNPNNEHICSVCDKAFKRDAYLKQHMWNHTDERPFSCEHCSKSFKTNNSLRQHKSTHNPKIEHVCTICHKGFKRDSYLKQHAKKHSQEKPFTCEYCWKSFKSKYTMNQHKLKTCRKRPTIPNDGNIWREMTRCKCLFQFQIHSEGHWHLHWLYVLVLIKRHFYHRNDRFSTRTSIGAVKIKMTEQKQSCVNAAEIKCLNLPAVLWCKSVCLKQSKWPFHDNRVPLLTLRRSCSDRCRAASLGQTTVLQALHHHRSVFDPIDRLISEVQHSIGLPSADARRMTSNWVLHLQANPLTCNSTATPMIPWARFMASEKLEYNCEL